MAFLPFQRQWRRLRDLFLSFLITCAARGADKPPVLAGLDAGFGLDDSISVRAIGLAVSAERPAVRDALERLDSHRGLVRRYNLPFTPDRHEAFGPEQLPLARFRPDGVLVPVRK